MSETGIYIRVGKDNVLLEDLNEIERTLWLESLSEKGLIRTVNRCCDVIEDFIVNYQHLETNWKELKKWLEKEIKSYEHIISPNIGYSLGQTKKVLNKMQEIESKNND